MFGNGIFFGFSVVLFAMWTSAFSTIFFCFFNDVIIDKSVMVADVLRMVSGFDPGLRTAEKVQIPFGKVVPNLESFLIGVVRLCMKVY